MKYELSRMAANPCALGPKDRLIVLKAIQEVCAGCGYTLIAVHVRTNHVHVVVSAQDDPEAVMGRLKGRASFELNRCDGRRRKRWSRHGSTRYLWREDEVVSAVNYVLFGQGEMMAMYPADLEAR